MVHFLYYIRILTPIFILFIFSILFFMFIVYCFSSNNDDIERSNIYGNESERIE